MAPMATMTTVKKQQDAQILQSEDDILACINSLFPEHHHKMSLGRGDDCAVMKTPAEVCVSTDLFLEDVHFRRSYFSPEEIGHKALAVNISDIAAMGAKPLAFSMGLMLPKDIERDYLQRMMQGMVDLAQQYDLALSGGDISRSARLGFSITIYGEAQSEKGKFLQRGTCHEGDIIFILGEIGLARVGLLSLEKQGRMATSFYPTACQAHLLPQPLVAAGRLLAEAGHMLTDCGNIALMDLSDGLARDMHRLLGKNQYGQALGADLEITEDMLHADMLAFAEHELREHEGQDATCLSRQAILNRALHHAFMGGEDYALLGACAPAMFEKIQAMLAMQDEQSTPKKTMPTLHRIGVVTSGLMSLNGRMMEQTGFDHFATSK